MKYITHDELIYCILKEYPTLVHGKDFWVGQPMGDDGLAQTDDAFIVQWKADGVAEPDKNAVAQWKASYLPIPAPAPTQSDYRDAITAHLDAKAQERGYDGILTGITYRDDPNAQYAAEGKALFDWRSEVWTYATAQLAQVQSGGRPQPPVSDFITEIDNNCPFTWPA